MSDPILELADVNVYYGAIHALKGVSLTVRQGEVVTLIGANGAGKTTTLATVCGLMRPRSGTVHYGGEDIGRVATHQLVARGLVMAPEGRGIFPALTVEENLRLGAYARRDKAGIEKDLQHGFEIFPRLAERRRQRGGTLSGGEQQMLAIGRALMSQPRFLMMDEPSLGIAPLLVKTIFEKIVEINRTRGLTILLVEQNANLALEISHYGYVLETGKIILQADSATLRADPQVRSAYLGG